MLLEVLRSQGDELLADLLLARHHGFQLLSIVHIISQTIIICREQMSYDLFLIWMVFLTHDTLDHSVAVGEGVQTLLIQGIEVV